MRIAQIAPIVERVPPKKYGGTERVVSVLTEELVEMGHKVTLFASGDSITSAKLSSVYPRGIREANMRDLYGSNIYTLLNIGAAYDMQGEFDIIHDHTGYIGLATANMSRTPVVSTMHGPMTSEARKIFERLNKPYLVSISNAQVRPNSNLNHLGTVYNGLNMTDYPYSDEHDGCLLFVGRICMEKGTHIAIEVAQILDMPLVIAAKLEPIDIPYFKEYVSPWLGDSIKWVGEVDERERNELFTKAKALLHPVTWREPFGLTMIESMACGCPVVAFNKGSIPEVVVDGKTGFVVSDLEEMVDAVLSLPTIDRQVCREHALMNFNGRKMAEGYLEIYKKALAIHKKRNVRPKRQIRTKIKRIQ